MEVDFALMADGVAHRSDGKLDPPWSAPCTPLTRRRRARGDGAKPSRRNFYERYNDEAWAYVTPEQLRSDGTGLHGFDVEKLKKFLSALRS